MSKIKIYLIISLILGIGKVISEHEISDVLRVCKFISIALFSTTLIVGLVFIIFRKRKNE